MSSHSAPVALAMHLALLSDACPNHQPSRRDRQGRPLPPGPGARHHRAAGDNEPDRQRRETSADDHLPRRLAKPIPQPVGDEVHAARWREGGE